MASVLGNVWGSIIRGTVFRPHASLSKNPIVKHAVGEECIHMLLLAGPFFSFSLKVQVMLLINLISSVSVCTTLYHGM